MTHDDNNTSTFIESKDNIITFFYADGIHDNKEPVSSIETKELRWLFFILCDSTILLYDTNNYDETQAYDCIYYDGDDVLFINNME